MRASNIIFIVLVLYGCGQQNSPHIMSHDTAQDKDTIAIKNTNPPDSIIITLMLPKDIKKYDKAVIDYTNDGGVDPSYGWAFAPAQIRVPYTTDALKASARAAAKILSSYGDSIMYFKIKDKTAYVLLEMDLNGWAGVTYTIRKVHPIIERTLLHFPQIDKVAFDYAPEDQKRRQFKQ
ncbi:MAG: hypothetical protein K0S09_722 [Sphingobacteriaceae bacterium]|jgi:hypothetical protein|nr:hypothetical protein [Sphingobacteriaceae bacterium]